MPLMEHLRELRGRLTKAMIALVLGSVVGYFVYDIVWEILKAPYCSLPESEAVDPEGCSLIVTGPFDAFFVAFKVWAFVGALVSAPFWLYQLWAFVAPALHSREKKYAYIFAPLAAVLFIGGAVLAYYVTSLALTMLFGFLPEDALTFLTIGEYLDYMVVMMGMFGLGFVLPLLVALLNLTGVLPHAVIAKWRRVIIFATFAIAAIITPAEPISMLALAVPLVLLFEIAEVFAFLNDRRKRRDDPYADLDDDEISELDDELSPLEDTESEPETGKRT
ncbi:twin-arginine translocase subunit TatC [Nocardiopsis sp. NRRL B-16309]|uniref:twin-arginine translocase subunit TatC n=1 Tax=Nocardiopsis sp. NRRL B-16309 TaxID=1519494 RepID=UPI0006AF9E2A|nr:twin-arginine translocase subunit TatC [Nocardiopsis sp. NRRL B-16309]KOX15384.1 preprotein translocase subunit TatC [Nocardiopsis sp. NRRL B-16309]